MNGERRAVCDWLAGFLARPENLRAARLEQSGGRQGAATGQPAADDPDLRQLEALLGPGALQGGGGGAQTPARDRSPDTEDAGAGAQDSQAQVPGASGESAAPLQPARSGDEPRAISIWEPRWVDGELVYERPPPLPLGDHYAATRRLHPRPATGARRICLLGESAAAGYLYAPHLTPARVLEAQLRHLAGAGAYEVVDLARTNETLASLVETAERALQLRPDLFLIFAGNNWNLLETPEVSPYAPSVSARQRYAGALREAGVEGPVRLALETMAGKALGALGRLGEISRETGVRVVLLLPEVNLADWETRQPVVWLPGEGSVAWHATRERAEAALARGAWQEATTAALRMLDLDGGTCPTSFRLLARARLGEGRTASAREACLAEVDSGSYATLCFLGAPQATTAARKLQARAAADQGFTTVDLRQVFARHCGGGLPGRRLFLDYCHLTAEGMKVAMAASAAEILRLTGGPEVPSGTELAMRLPDPDVSPEAEATARLGAAVHTAHRLLPVGPKAPILEHWCREALRASAGVAAAMVDLAAARTAPCPEVLTRAQQRNLSSPYRLGFQHGWRYDHVDGDLLAAMAAVLDEVEAPEAREVARLLAAAPPLPDSGLELAEPARLAEPLERFYPEVMSFADLPERATLRAAWPRTGFLLRLDGSQALELALTLRLPPVPGAAASRSGPVSVEVNGEAVGEVAAGESWSRRRLRASGALLAPGLNRISLGWPALPPVGESAFEAAARRLEEGVEADLHPVFGEVASLRVRPATGNRSVDGA